MSGTRPASRKARATELPRLRHWLTHPIAVALLLVALVSIAAAETVPLRLPPAALAAWYQPQNERQVWLHTMFGLREAMQAVEEHSAAARHEDAARWAERLQGLYAKIPQMVPEWANEVEPESAAELVAAARSGDRPATAAALRRLGHTCKGCHVDYQAVAAALYRSPDYHRVPVVLDGATLTYPEAMEAISRSLNRVKIGLKDGAAERTLGAVDELEGRLAALAGSCGECHRDDAPRERIFAHVPDLLESFRGTLRGGDRRQQGRLLGELGVTVCARCHGVHRTLSDLRHEIVR